MLVSWYSYVALAELLANREKLASHGVEIEYIPLLPPFPLLPGLV